MNLLAVDTVVVMSPEPGPTHTALVRQFSSMEPLVIETDGFLGKHFPTKCALLFLDPGTGLPVSGEVVVAPEVLPAEVARELVGGLVSQHVLVQTPFSPPLELFATHLAREEGRVVLHLLVDLVIILVSLPAELTFKLSITAIALIRHLLRVHLSLMSSDLYLLPEPLGAVLAAKLEEVSGDLLVLNETELVGENLLAHFAPGLVTDMF